MHIAKTGQVAIQVRDVQGASGGDGQDDNPFDWDEVCKNIEAGLLKDGFKRGQEYEIMLVPNIVNITYGRGVGYTFEEEVFDSSVTEISATKIRQKLQRRGQAGLMHYLVSQDHCLVYNRFSQFIGSVAQLG